MTPAFPVVYDEATDHTTGPTPGALTLMTWALQHYPPGTNLGIWVARPQRGTTAPSVHWCGRAIDVGYPDLRHTTSPDRLSDGRHREALALAVDIVAYHAELGVQCVIYAAIIWSTKTPMWHKYDGVEQHWGHVHIELTHQAGQQLTATTIADAVTPPQEEPDMALSPADINDWIDRSYAAAGNDDKRGKRGWARSAITSADPFKTLAEMDRQLGLA